MFEGVDPIQPIPFDSSVQGGLPPDIPRYILQTKDNKVNFTISGIRFDFNFYDTEITLENIKKYVKDISDILVNIALPSYRIGIVLDGIINTDDIDRFIGQYLNVKNVSDASELQLSIRNNFEINGLNYNEWIRYVIFKNNPTVNFQIDVNNVNDISSSLLSSNNGIIIDRVGGFIGS